MINRTNPRSALNSAPSVRHRRLACIGAAIVILGSVGGCSTMGTQGPTPTSSTPSSHGRAGQSLDAAREQLRAMPGLTDTSVQIDQTVSGLNKHHQVLVTATAEDPSQLPMVIDKLAQLGWSVSEHEPDTGVYVRLKLTPQPVIGDIAKANGWTDAAYATSTDRLKQLVLLPEVAVEERFGKWPGAVPDSSK
ncbi:MAG: hypothetical protein AAGC90_05415 [Curtobacterium sp.]